jgi:hypothetical protein
MSQSPISLIGEVDALKTPPHFPSNPTETGTKPLVLTLSAKTNISNSIVANFGSFDVNFSSQSQETEFCGIGVDVASPAGYQFSAASTSYKDSIDVGSGVTASHILSYTFSGSESPHPNPDPHLTSPYYGMRLT